MRSHGNTVYDALNPCSCAAHVQLCAEAQGPHAACVWMCAQEMAQGGIAARPLRRCAARVVAQWAAEVEAEDRPAVYRALLQIMAEPDACMKVSACALVMCMLM